MRNTGGLQLSAWLAATAFCLAALLGPLAPPAAAQEADRQFAFAVRLMQRDEPKLAADAFRDFIRRHEEDRRTSDAHYYLALLARQRGDLAAARDHLGRVEDPLHVGTAELDLTRGQVRLEAGDPRGAVEALERVDPQKLADDETRATRLYLLGAAYRSLDNPQAAAERFAEAGEAASAVRAVALLELGKVRVELDRPAAAVDALREALRIGLEADAAAEARSLAAGLAYRMGQHEMAADYYQQIIENHQAAPQFESALIGRLRALNAAGQHQRLIEQHRAIRELLLTRARAEALYLLADAHVRLGQYERALATLEDFHRRYGADHPLAEEAAYLYALGLYRTDLDRFERWVAGDGIDLSTNPHGRELRYLRAQAAARQQRYQDAIEHLTPLIQQPEKPYARRALLQRAVLREQTEQTEAAAADYAAYAQRYDEDENAAAAARRAIDLAFRSGQFERVIELARPWLEGERPDGESRAAVRFELAVALIKRGQHDAALDELSRMLDGDLKPTLAAYANYYRGLILASRVREGDTDTVESEDNKAAIEALRSALRGPLNESQRVEALALTARLHRLAGREEQSLRAYERLREEHPIREVEAATAVWVGRGLHGSGDHEAALAWLRAVAEREDAPPAARAEALFLAAESYRKLGRVERAVQAYRRVVAYSRGYGDQGRLGLARALTAVGRPDEAINEYAGLIDVEASPIAAAALLESALLHLERARRRAAAGDSGAAEAQREQARKRLHRVTILYGVPELADIHARALLALARLDAAAGEDRKARERLEQITGAAAMSAWHDAARAEQRLLNERRGEGVFLLRKMIEANGAESAEVGAADTTEPAGYARRRLRELGETPAPAE